MRKIDHTKRYSKEDIAFLRQAGAPYMEDWIQQNGKTHGYDPDAPDAPEDVATRATIGTEAVVTPPGGVDPATSAPRLVDPTGGDVEDVEVEDEGDDYDKWKIPELEAEVNVRNTMPDTTNVEVTGTGNGGKVIKADLIKALRLWDEQNPTALDSDGD